MARPKAIHDPAAVSARFWAKVDKGDGCWVWTAYTNRAGYGWFSVKGSPMLAHRFAYMEAVGPIPSGLLICHTCDNPPCVNPDHLYAGTHKQNSGDMVARGRSPRAVGERSGKAKWTDAEVQSLVDRVVAGEKVKDVAVSVGMGPDTLTGILNGDRRRGSVDLSAYTGPYRIDHAEVARLYLSGLTMSQVAERVGTDNGNVSRSLASSGIKARPHVRTVVNDDELRRLHASPGFRVPQIAERLNVGEAVVRRRMRELGLASFASGRHR